MACIADQAGDRVGEQFFLAVAGLSHDRGEPSSLARLGEELLAISKAVGLEEETEDDSAVR
jgi:hypothetical protein